MLTLIKTKSLEDIRIEFSDLLARKSHFLIRINMVAVEGQRLFHSLVHDTVQPRFVGVAKLLIKGTDHMLRALDQIVIVQNQVPG